MEILKRLVQVLQWGGFALLAVGVWIMIMKYNSNSGLDNFDIVALPIIFGLPYLVIIATRWILFKEWIFLPWKKGTTKED